ncbi:hypothetical protein BHM03_00046811 [Ensete ventricosum]|nr:hypothetical protein BHM03_00046811 [Ensete ventricosum]
MKKRVERSSDDPAVVVTTYEGQHTHPSPIVPCGAHHVPLCPLPLLPAEPSMPPPLGFGISSSVNSNEFQFSLLRSYLEDYGLLQDLIPSKPSAVLPFYSSRPALSLNLVGTYCFHHWLCSANCYPSSLVQIYHIPLSCCGLLHRRSHNRCLLYRCFVTIEIEQSLTIVNVKPHHPGYSFALWHGHLSRVSESPTSLLSAPSSTSLFSALIKYFATPAPPTTSCCWASTSISLNCWFTAVDEEAHRCLLYCCLPVEAALAGSSRFAATRNCPSRTTAVSRSTQECFPRVQKSLLLSAILQPSIASLSLFWRHLTSLGDQKSFLLFLLQGLVLAMQTCCTQPSRSRNRKLQLLTSMINQNHPSETDEVTDYLSELLSGSHGWTTLANKLRTTLANPLTSAASSRFWTLIGRCKSKRPGTKKRRSGRRNNHNRRYSGSGCSCCTQPNVEGVDGRGSSPSL